jgi:hypothetical protein
MTRTAKTWRALACLCLLVLAAGVAAPHFRADRFADRIRSSLERALGRRVEIGDMRFSFLTGPEFSSVDRVVIHENPAIGMEPFAYGSLVARPRLLSLLTGHLEFSTIRLEDASINLVKSGPGSEPGHWNFEPLLSRNLLTTFPEIHVLGRINFKFGETKSVFYLTDADLDVTPPSHGASDWRLRFTGAPARTDRPARGFGSLEAAGSWSGDRLNLNVELKKSAVGEIIALLRGHHAGIHGLVSSRLHLSGPLHDIQISGGLSIEDIHRWDLMPPKGNEWPLAVQGRLNALAQTIEFEAHSASRETPPVSVRFRASDYLSAPHWGVSVNWNQFPLAPLLDLARHMGAEVPPKLKVAGTVDGAIGFSGGGSMQGELGFRDTAVTIPDSAPMRFEKARLLFDRGHLHLAPAIVHTAQDDQAELEGDYDFGSGAFDLAISTESLDVASLRSQVALAAVPWLEQVRAGHWKGQLRYQFRPVPRPAPVAGWNGHIELADAEIPIPGLAVPLRLESAAAQIQGARVMLEHIRARAGRIAIQGEYRYEPGATRPHRVHVIIPELDAVELERVLLPTLRRRRGLIARALNFVRAPVPDWLAERHVDGSVQVGVLTVAGARIERLRAHLSWDAMKAELGAIQARMENGTITGQLTANLRGASPTYRLVSHWLAVDCRAGKMDADATLETSGTGAELLANLRSEGTFNGRAVELASLPAFKTVSGSYKLVWSRNAPRLQFTDVQVATGGEVYTGRGATQEDGRILVQLSNGAKEMRLTGTLAQLHADESPVAQ